MSRNFVIISKKGEQVAEIDAGTFAGIMDANKGEMQLVTAPNGRGVSAYVVTVRHSWHVATGLLLGPDIALALDEGYRIYRAEDVFK